MKKYIIAIVISLLFLAGIGVYQYFRFYDGKLHVVFCSVGQGDAVLMWTPERLDLLVDGGPERRVLDCLGKHLPFWERNLDMVFLTHPHSDHFTGLYYVLDLYNVLSFDTERLVNKSQAFKQLVKKINEKKVMNRIIAAGDRFRVGKDVVVEVESPGEDVLKKYSPNGEIGEMKEQASLILHVIYKNFDILLTGDSQAEELKKVADAELRKIEVLQVPHHGSTTGMNEEILKLLAPKLAVISVGEKNSYGLPKKDVLDMLKGAGVKTLRTDMGGDIEIISDGVRWWRK